MGTRTTKKLYFKTLAEEAPKFFSQLGFAYTEPGVLWRTLGVVDHGFFLTPDPSCTHYSVEVGANVAGLDERLDYVSSGGAHYTTLLVSRPLGLLRPPGRKGEQLHYHFATVEELRTTFPHLYADFVERAEPWLAGLTTVEDVAKEFHKWRIAPPGPKLTRPPDPFAWAIYGWLLKEAGNELQARPWLERALAEVRRPMQEKVGRIIPRGNERAGAIKLNEAEMRLGELLEQELREPPPSSTRTTS